VVPCVLPVQHPVIVPLSSLGGILKVATEVRMGAVERELRISLDTETQATSRLIEGEFPPIDRVMRDTWRGSIQVGKLRLVEALTRMMNLIRSERMPSMEVTIDGSGLIGMLTFDMEVEQVGRMQDTVDVDASNWDDTITFHMRPQMLMNAVDHSKSDNVTIFFGHTDPIFEPKSTIAVKDDRGYECHLTRLMK
jgi:DNA polymerase III sliding clamp (beta) subunit (PCNA family)